MADRFRTDWPRAAALAALTAVGVYLCYRIASPFLPGVVWAVALAVVGVPLHRRVTRLIPNANWSAGLTTAAVVLVIAVPVVLVARQLAAETAHAAARVQEQTADGRWRDAAARVPVVGETLSAIDPREVESQVRDAAREVAARSVGFAQGAAGGLVQALVAVFVLFFLFRDRHHILGETRKLLPLDAAAADRVIGRGEDAVHATVYGTLLTAVIQGVTGGLLFWALGLPMAVLWGAVMIVLGALPFVGAFLVWVPAAVYLASVDRWPAAAALTAWGVIMAGPVSNYVYAMAAGNRMRMHPVPTLLAFVGGLAVFGVSGMVLGPCVLAVTAALLDVWRHRAADGIPVAAHTTKPNTQENGHGHSTRLVADAPPA